MSGVVVWCGVVVVWCGVVGVWGSVWCCEWVATGVVGGVCVVRWCGGVVVWCGGVVAGGVMGREWRRGVFF